MSAGALQNRPHPKPTEPPHHSPSSVNSEPKNNGVYKTRKALEETVDFITTYISSIFGSKVFRPHISIAVTALCFKRLHLAALQTSYKEMR